MTWKVVLSLAIGLCLACLLPMAHAQPVPEKPSGPAAEGGPAGEEMASIVEGKPAGIEVGDCAPNFELEPIEIHDDYKRWLGDEAPKSFEDKVMLSDFVGKAPIVLLLGSYT